MRIRTGPISLAMRNAWEGFFFNARTLVACTAGDVDARIVAEEEAVLDAVSEIGDAHDLPLNWLNQHARLFIR